MSEQNRLEKITISSLTCFKFEAFPAAHGFFSRKGGKSSYPYSSLNTAFKTNDPAAPLNRELLFKAVGIENHRIFIISPNHGTHIAFMDNIKAGEEKIQVLTETDAAFTSIREAFFLISAADCVILLLTDPALSFAGVVHLGWRNLVNEFTGKVIRNLASHYQLDVSSLIVGISPCIYPCCYRFQNPVQKESDFWQPFLHHLGDEHYAIDLVSAVKAQLRQTGVVSENIHEANLCTGCNNDFFFSCYKEGYVSGRFPTLIGLQSP